MLQNNDYCSDEIISAGRPAVRDAPLIYQSHFMAADIARTRCYTKNGISNNAIMLIILIIGFIAGPAVSL